VRRWFGLHLLLFSETVLRFGHGPFVSAGSAEPLEQHYSTCDRRLWNDSPRGPAEFATFWYLQARHASEGSKSVHLNHSGRAVESQPTADAKVNDLNRIRFESFRALRLRTHE
jgi:hypothetical protein